MPRWRRHARPLPMLLFSVALAGLLLGAASLPHTHDPGRPGLYNQEHDLGYLATLGGAALAPETPAASPLVVVVLLALFAAASAPCLAWRRHADFRAPPLR